MSASGDVASRLAEVRERIAAAAVRAGRSPADVLLVGVSKGVGSAAIGEAVRAGLADLGENRAQELVAKAADLGRVGAPDGGGAAPRWHFVGRLQRNKVRLLAPHVTLWQSIDRPELGAVLARRAPGARVLVEVNLGAEPQKGGCTASEAGALVDDLSAAGLSVEGLMTVPPSGTDPRPYFAALRDLAGTLGLAQVSMGMTADFEAAVEEGATIVRIGTAIFGSRPAAAGLRR